MMKTLTILAVSGLALSCCRNISGHPPKAPDTVRLHRVDTVRLVQPVIKTRVDTVYVSNTHHADSLRHVVDSLREKLFLANYKVERVRYYLNITLRNPRNDKFLKGWIKRAIE